MRWIEVGLEGMDGGWMESKIRKDGWMEEG